MDKVSTYALNVTYGTRQAVLQVPIKEKVRVYQKLRGNKLYIHTEKPADYEEGMYNEYVTHKVNHSSQVKVSVYQALKPIIESNNCPRYMDIYKENDTTFVCIPSSVNYKNQDIGEVNNGQLYIGKAIRNKLTRNFTNMQYKYKVTVYYGKKAYIEICAVAIDEKEKDVFTNCEAFTKAVRKNNRIHKNVVKASYYVSSNFIGSYIVLQKHIIRTLNLKHGSKAQVITLGNKLMVIGADEECFITGKKINRLVHNCNELTVTTDTAEKIQVMKSDLSTMVDIDTITSSTDIIRYLSEEIKNI